MKKRKKCSVCFKNKKVTEFYVEGRGRGDGYRAKCKSCSYTDVEKNRARKWREKNKNTVRKQKLIERGKLASLGDSYIKKAIRSAIKRAKDKGYSNYDTKEKLFEYLKSIGGVPKKCPILGIPLEYGGGSSANSPSLDRIDVRKGYQVGNVWFISARANMMKNNASFKELQTFSKYFIENFTARGKKKD